MYLTLILGPMKSGKSLELISRFAHLKYSDVPFKLYQPKINVRDEKVSTRNGMSLPAQKIDCLKEIPLGKYDMIGIEEVHMFKPTEIKHIDRLLKAKTRIVASGLDLDHAGRLITTIKKLIELGPCEVIYRKAVCEQCKSIDAAFTQVLESGIIVPKNFPSVLPEDGRYQYLPLCRKCFQRT